MALDFVAGCFGGCAGVLVGHPFDTIKVRLQTDDFRQPKYKGTLHCLATTIRNESVGGLYKGMSSPMAGVALVNAVVFGVYGNVQRRLPQPESYTSHTVAGAVAGAAQAFIASPMELVKSRLQLQDAASGTKLYSSPMHCLRTVFHERGIPGVFRGLQVTIWRDTPGFGSYFLAYEVLTKASQKDSPPLSTWQMLLAGGLAGTVSWVSCYPIDVIKSRLQVDGMHGPARYTGVMDCYRKSVAAEGYGVLTRGLTSTILRAFPTNAACFAVVSWVFRLVETNEEPAAVTVMSEHLPAAAAAAALLCFDERPLAAVRWPVPVFGGGELLANSLVAALDSPGPGPGPGGPETDSFVYANFSQIVLGNDCDGCDSCEDGEDCEECSKCITDAKTAAQPELVSCKSIVSPNLQAKSEEKQPKITL